MNNLWEYIMKQLKVIENFFENEEITFIKNYAEDILNTQEILSSDIIDNWHKKLNTSTNRINTYHINSKIDSELYEIISEKIKKSFNMEIKGSSFYFWLNNSNINWHNDSGHAGAATIYLNRNWDKNWGGYFVYENDNKLGIEIPKYNKCIFQTGGIEHATTPVDKKAPIRKSLQIFLK
jgi:hypothetical protein